MKAKKHTIETHDKFHLVTEFVDGHTVSTMLNNNPYHGIRDYETCIFYPNKDNNVVQYYESEGKARAGHATWVNEIATKGE